METTKLKLAIRLQEISSELAERAEQGEFSDYESEHATPKIILARCLHAISSTTANLKRRELANILRKEVMNGDWDETKEEAEAWFEREGKDLLANRANPADGKS